MRLIDLDPRWFEGRSGDRQGITFECPHCPTSGQRLAVAIHLDGTDLDPDPENPQQWAAGEHVWALGEGVTGFADMTLTPSVDASGSGHWHGHITGGEIA